MAHGKSGEPHGKTVDDWIDKHGWLEELILAGATESPEIEVDHSTEELVPFGQIFGALGHKLTGRDRPHLGTEETPTGVIVTLSKPAGEDITVLYKIEGLDDIEIDEAGAADD
ncbi:hypothetical protein UFOVP1244_90 [uncultured Caudovirales phage]|uniref:Uncharacterized protein n=1 Tax=uncultured Caudovirales phage TaxID=2100421 RepID=A0A6J5R7A5_9CAUD|nr:hypothetical protein UFOVP1244_90 [uncultured Caudovirales phage]